MVTAAETTRPREADLRPFSISVTYRDFLYRPNRQYRVTDRQMPEMTQPRVARTAPGSPAIRTPTKVDRNNISENFLGNPAPGGHYLFLNIWDDCIAAADAEKPYFKESGEKV